MRVKLTVLPGGTCKFILTLLEKAGLTICFKLLLVKSKKTTSLFYIFSIIQFFYAFVQCTAKLYTNSRVLKLEPCPSKLKPSIYSKNELVKIIISCTLKWVFLSLRGVNLTSQCLNRDPQQLTWIGIIWTFHHSCSKYRLVSLNPLLPLQMKCIYKKLLLKCSGISILYLIIQQ